MLHQATAHHAPQQQWEPVQQPAEPASQQQHLQPRAARLSGRPSRAKPLQSRREQQQAGLAQVLLAVRVPLRQLLLLRMMLARQGVGLSH
jgi:hypothetical protein